MHGPINVKSPKNINKWEMGYNSAFKGLKYIVKKWDGVWSRLTWLRIGEMAVSRECGNEASGSMKCGEFLD
jgi:hypothetical protein